MDPEAERRARRKRIVEDLARATDDEEACPPEWTDILIEVRRRTSELQGLIGAEADRFASEPDVRIALVRRERICTDVRARVESINTKIQRLNLIAPLPRFHRRRLDADELLKPLFRTRRLTG